MSETGNWDKMSETGSFQQTGSHNGSAAESNRRCVSVNDIRRAFEKAEQSLQAAAKGLPEMSPCHNRMSSLDSTNSDESSIPTPQHCYGSVSSLISGRDGNNMRDHYGSISSLASSTSIISSQVNYETFAYFCLPKLYPQLKSCKCVKLKIPLLSKDCSLC